MAIFPMRGKRGSGFAKCHMHDARANDPDQKAQDNRYAEGNAQPKRQGPSRESDPGNEQSDNQDCRHCNGFSWGKAHGFLLFFREDRTRHPANGSRRWTGMSLSPRTRRKLSLCPRPLILWNVHWHHADHRRNPYGGQSWLKQQRAKGLGVAVAQRDVPSARPSPPKRQNTSSAISRISRFLPKRRWISSKPTPKPCWPKSAST